MTRGTFNVDFIARGEVESDWKMVLVEQGPWTNPIDDELRRLQGRLYDCIDAILDGQLAVKFPESTGKRIIIQVDGYELPEQDVRSFFDRFATGSLKTGGYELAMQQSGFASSIAFTLNLA